jgi:hypothetical protein
MTTRFQDVDISECWAQIPPMRRHLYFYLLLLLVTVVAASFQDPSAVCPVSGEETAPALSVNEIYSPPAGQ